MHRPAPRRLTSTVAVENNADVTLDGLLADPENEGIRLKAPQSVLNNYFSIGSDADTALQARHA